LSDAGKQRSAEEQQVLAMVRWLLYLVFAVIAFFVLRAIGPVLAPLLAAAAVAYLLDGAVDAAEARGINRTLAVALLMAGFVALVVVLLVVVAPLVSDEVARFAANLPALIDRASALLSRQFGVELPTDWRAYLEGPEFRAFVEESVGPATSIVVVALGGVFGFLGWLAELLLVPVLAFYVLVDWDSIVGRLHAFVPPRHRERVAEIAGDIDHVVSLWVRGQLMVMAILAALYATAFKVIGLPLGITIGVMVGLLTVIPFLGTFAGAALALLMVLLDWQGPGQLAAVAATFLVLHLVEAAVLTPRLVGKRVGLGEVGALLAVLAGGQLLGFTGVLLAVPIAASIAVLVRRAVGLYEASSFFTDGDEVVAGLEVGRPNRPVRRRGRRPPPSRVEPESETSTDSGPAAGAESGPDPGKEPP
jgi:predicted PurR-regulated permease PerM